MRRILHLGIFLLALSAPIFAQTGAVQNHCYLGGAQAITSGLKSTNYANGIVPACTVTVYLTGTTTKATIYADSISTPLANPFTANVVSSVDPGGWIFWAATNQGLDVVMSGGNSNPSCTTAPNCYTQPVTLTDVYPSSSLTPVAGVDSAQGTAPITVNGASGTPETGNITIACANATNSTIGCSRPDGTTITASAGVLSVPAGSLLGLQHNGSNVPDQSLLNFVDTPTSLSGGSLDAGFQAVKFKNDAVGGLAAETLTTQNQFQPAFTPPQTGNYVILYPTSAVASNIPGTPPVLSNAYASSTWPFSGIIERSGSGSSGVSSDSQIVWTGFGQNGIAGLPSGITPSQVTALYWGLTFGSAGSIPYSVPSSGITYGCSAGSCPVLPGPHLPVPQQTILGSSWSGSGVDYSTLNVTAEDFRTDICPGGGAFWGYCPEYNTWQPFLIVYYTGAVVPQPNTINIQPPLYLNNGNLGIQWPYNTALDIGTTNAYQISLPALYNQSVTYGTQIMFWTANANTSTTPTIQIQGNGSLYTIEGRNGGAISAGDIAANHVAVLVYDNDGNMRLQNPQTTSGSIPYPGAGIANSTGSAWGTSYGTTGSGTNVALATSPVFGGTPDASAASQFKLPVAAGYVSAANGELGYDSTNANWHLWNSADAILSPLAAGFVSGNCGQPTQVGGKWVLADAGAPCGSGGGGLPSGVKGQVPTNNGSGGTSYTAQSPTIGVANGGALITTSYQLLCDSATVATGIQDRGRNAQIGAGGSVTIPDLAGTGCTGFYGLVTNTDTASHTVSRQTSDTFNVYDPAVTGGPTTGQTSFTLAAGQHASFVPNAISATQYDVFKSATPGASGGGFIPSNAIIAVVGNSIVFDDYHKLSTALPITAWSTTSGITTVTNSGTNNLYAGEWIDTNGMTGWPINSGALSGTGTRLFQVLSTGLTSTQFEINTTGISPGSCSSSCGSAYPSMAYLPMQIAKRPGMPAAAISNVKAYCSATDPSSNACTIYGLDSNYSTVIHPVSPAVTGQPGYLVLIDPNNDIALGYTEANIESYYRDIFTKAHADGWTVVTGGPPSVNYSAGEAGTPATFYKEQDDINTWLKEQGKQTVLASSPSSTAYWDIFSDIYATINDGGDTTMVFDNGGLEPGGSNMLSSVIASDLLNGSGRAMPQTSGRFGNSIDGGYASTNGWIYTPPFDGHLAFQWTNAAKQRVAFMDSASGQFFLPGSSACIGIQTSTCSRPFQLGPFQIDAGGSLYGVGGISANTSPSHANCWDTYGGVTPCGTAGGGTSTGVVLINGVNPGYENQVGMLPVVVTDTSGSTTAQAGNSTIPTQIYWSPAAGNCFTYLTPNSNSTASLTLSVNGTGAKPVGYWNGTAITTTLPVGILPANVPTFVCFDGTNYDLVGLGGSGGGTTTNSLTMNSSGSGAASGATFNGSAAETISYNTIGAAPTASPTFTGAPTAPTATAGTNTTQLATTAFVQAAIAAASTGAGIVTYSGPSITFSGTQYIPIGGGASASATEANVDVDSPAAVTIQNMTVQMSAAPGTGNSVAFTWRKNGANQALTCTISNSATSCSDTTHQFTTSSLDLLSIQMVTSGTIVGTPTVVAAAQVGVAASGGTAFSSLTSGTNTGAAMVVGSGASLATTGTGTISANQLNSVPFCTGFTPTNGQNLQYTTASSPNPCYTAATGSSGSTLPYISANAYGGTSSSQSQITSSTMTVTSGDTVFGLCRGGGSSVTITMTTGLSNTCTQAGREDNSLTGALVSFTCAETNAGSETFKCNYSSAGTFESVIALNLKGTLGTVDNTAGYTITSTTQNGVNNYTVALSQKDAVIHCITFSSNVSPMLGFAVAGGLPNTYTSSGVSGQTYPDTYCGMVDTTTSLSTVPTAAYGTTNVAWTGLLTAIKY